jgi:predicted nucleic acid-binding protein
MLEEGEDLALTDPIVMELLAGARTIAEEEQIRARLVAHQLISVRGLDDFETAAAIYRTCRSRGATIRNLVDCLIAAVAIREDVPVLHNDADFEVIAQHTGLQTLTS